MDIPDGLSLCSDSTRSALWLHEGGGVGSGGECVWQGEGVNDSEMVIDLK